VGNVLEVNMARKLRIPFISDTVLVGDTYMVERRQRKERRLNAQKKVPYERRKSRDPRLPKVKAIYIII